MAVKMETEAPMLPAQERESQETIDSSSRGDIPLRWLTSILLLIFPTVTLFVNRGDSYVFGLLTLIGIWVWFRDGARRWLDRPSALLWIAFVLFFAVALLAYLFGTQTDAGFRFLGRYLRFLLVVPVYLALRRYPPTAKTTFIGLALGALFAGIIGGLHFYHADAAIRIKATTGLAIIFGDLATTMVLCTVAGVGFLASPKRKWLTPLLVICIAGGTAATLLSGTRGAWLSLIFLLPVVIIPVSRILERRYLFIAGLVIVVVFSSFYFIAQTDTHGRIQLAFHGTQDYFLAQSALGYGNSRAVSGLHCINQEPWLIAWAHFYYISDSELPPGLEVVRDPSIKNAHLCKEEYAVLLHNPSETKWFGYFFPRLTRDQGSVQSSVILARGAGWFEPNSTGAGGTRFDSLYYSKVAFFGDKWGGRWVRIFVAPGKSVWLVPLDNFYGEYSFAIAYNSIGRRLEMWRAAWTIFLSHPLVGDGTGAYQDAVARLIRKGEIFQFVAGYDHPHSDYFNALASAGIVGFLSLLAILLVPLVRFWRALRGKDSVSQAVGLAGALTVLGFAIYALTDTIFLHSMMITWYVVYMALFYALLSTRASRTAIAEPPEQ